MAITSKSRRPSASFRWLRYVALGLGLLGFAAGWGFATIEVDVAPICAVEVAGLPSGINAGATDALAHSDAVTDGLATADYQFEFPPGVETTLTVRLPWPMQVGRIVLLGWGDQKDCRLSVRLLDGMGSAPAAGYYWGSTSGVPPIRELVPPGQVERMELVFQGERRYVMNNVSIYVHWPRWLALTYWLALAVVGPWIIACFWLECVFGVGQAVVLALRSPLESMSARLVLGLAVAAVASTAPCIAVGSNEALAVPIALLLSGAAVQAARRLQAGLPPISQEETELRRLMRQLTLLLICAVAVETYLVRGNRIVPYDHLMPLFGAQRLAAGVAIPPDLAARPWLVHVLFVPLELVVGRFSYPAYVGFMAAFNSIVLVAVYDLLRRWQVADPLRASVTFATMPLLACLHFVGQRPASAGLMLLALLWWLSETAHRRPLLAGLAAALAVGAHPGALFVLPGLACWLAFGVFRKRSTMFERSTILLVLGLAIPVCAYATWSQAIHRAYPGFRNALNLYPIVPQLDGELPVGDSLLDAARRLGPNEWRTLAINRLRQLPHYFWSPSVRDRTVELFRPVSLPNGLGLLGMLLLVRPSIWRREPGLWICGIVSPLLVHHAYIGQSHGQFHISPLPFVMLAAMAAESMVRLTDTHRTKLAAAIRAEWLLRVAFPAGLTFAIAAGWYASPIGGLSIFAGDAACGVAAGMLTPAAWSWLMLRRPSKSPANVLT